MSIELRPVGTTCNIACQYCYQNGLRDAAGPKTPFDLEAVKKAVLDIGEPFNLFGGEPLLLPLADIEALIQFNLDTFGTAGSVQTNGVLLSDDHIALFQRLKATVSVSIDGPDDLNDARWAGSLQRTRQATEATLDAIERLMAAGQPPGLMVQLTRTNGVADRLERLCAWLGEMDAKGVRAARVHVLELDETETRGVHGLSVEENVAAVSRLIEAAKGFSTLRLDIASDRRQMLLMDDDSVVCTFRACDPLYTAAVTGVGPDGEPHKCGLTDKEGIDFLRPDQQGFERYLALHATPQAVGGCKNCRFFLACKGQCPGTGIDGDWRNRSESCEVWRQLFTLEEAALVAEGRVPISVHPRRREVESALLASWARGDNPTLSQVRARLGLDLETTRGAPA